MNIEQIYQYCLSKKGVTESFPFDEQTLVFKVLGKMFALMPLDKWDVGEGSINLKCNPEYALELRSEFDNIQPGYHMSKKHWNTIYIYKGEVPQKMIFELIDHSYNEVVKTLPKKRLQELF